MNQGRSQRILVVCQHFWPESFRINDVCDFLVEKGCEVDVLCGIPNYPKGAFYKGYGYFKNRGQQHNGVNIRRVFEIPRGNNKNHRIFLNYVSFPIASLFHIPRLLTKRYDRIFIFQLSPVMMAIAGIIVGKIKKTEVTMWALDLWPENLFSVIRVKNRFLKKLAQTVSHWHYRQADKIIALSETMAVHLRKITNLPPKQIIVIPQVAEKIYEKYFKDKNLAKRFATGFNIVFTGNISPAQSFKTILAAAKMLRSKGILDINWIIVGDGMSHKWLVAEVKKLGLSSNFYFEGWKPIEEIPKYTALADVLVGCLVKSELLEATIPAKVMAYVAAGKPLVLAMDGEVQSLVNNVIKCGFAGPAGNANAFASNLEKLYLLSPAKRAKMGKRARAYHFKHFERNKNMAKLYEFIFD